MVLNDAEIAAVLRARVSTVTPQVFGYSAVSAAVMGLYALDESSAARELRAWVDLWGGEIRWHTDRPAEIELPSTSWDALQALPPPGEEL